MLNAQPEIADAPIDRMVEVVKTLNESRQRDDRHVEQSGERRPAGGDNAELERRRVDFVECELDLLKFDLTTFIGRQPKVIALALARERYERAANCTPVSPPATRHSSASV